MRRVEVEIEGGIRCIYFRVYFKDCFDFHERLLGIAIPF
jgi:hypothetical protein